MDIVNRLEADLSRQIDAEHNLEVEIYNCIATRLPEIYEEFWQDHDILHREEVVKILAQSLFDWFSIPSESSRLHQEIEGLYKELQDYKRAQS